MTTFDTQSEIIGWSYAKLISNFQNKVIKQTI